MSKKTVRKHKNWSKCLRAYWRKHFLPVWQEMGWPLVASIWILNIILGYVGFLKYAEATGSHSTGLDLLYRSIQLIVLESGDIEDQVPWQLEIARFLMPVLAAYTAIQALLTIFSKQWQLLRVRFFKNHVVICGLGERGLRLAQEFSLHGYRVVVVEEDKDNFFIEQCRKKGAVILFGNATSRNYLRRAGVQRAKYLVAVCADDGTNAEIALKARDIVRFRKRQDLTVFVHLADLELCNLLKGWEFVGEAESFRLEFFNVMDKGARLMLNQHSPFINGSGTGQKQPWILIVGMGKMGRSLIVQAAKEWWRRHESHQKRLRITVIDNAAASKIEVLQLQYPQLEKVCEFDIRQMEKNAPEFERAGFLFDQDGSSSLNAIYICFDDDVHVLVSALTLLRKTIGQQVPIVMRMSGDAGLATLIRKEQQAFDFRNIYTFGLLDMTCNLETLLGGTHEIIARAIHEDYVNHRKESGETILTNPSLAEWEDLPEDIRESNRHQAAHIDVKMKAINCSIQPLTDWEAASFKFSPEEIELLAEMEHERWCTERRQRGWTYASGPKNIKKKTSPYLISWNKLSNEIREHDRNMVTGLPSFIAQAGFQINRRKQNGTENKSCR